MPLTISPCRSLCDWARTPAASEAGEPVFACRGCGSQWVRSEPWAPRQADGTWPDGVREELEQARRRGALRPGAGAAGSAGS